MLYSGKKFKLKFKKIKIKNFLNREVLLKKGKLSRKLEMGDA